MKHPPRVLLGLSAGLFACGGSASRNGFEDNPAPNNAPPAPTGTSGDFGKDKGPPAPPSPAGEVSEVYGHSSTLLFLLDPKTKAVTEVAPFGGCESVIDMALDEASTLYAVSFSALYLVDKKTAKCTEIARGPSTPWYPNSLSFVPKGTVDPNLEALVGYEGGDYVRIDTKTGAKTVIGTLGGGLASSGDIVSVKGGKTYLTVKGTGCQTSDCLVEVNPANGSLLKNWGSVGHKSVFGLAFWAASVYGFDDTGNLFEVTFGPSSITTTAITIPNKPSKLSFWGAGSTTSAPLVPTTK